MYTDFASVYDRLMQDVDYNQFAQVYEKLLQISNVPPGSAVAECACGTGNISIPLSESYTVTGIDLSEEMLSRAVQKAREHGKRITFIKQDMQNLCLHRPVSSVIATCDGLNYLSPSGVKRFLSKAFTNLLPGGALCFDISSEYKLKNIIANNTFTLTEDDICYIWQNRLSDSKNSVFMQLDIFVKNNGSYDRINEEQQQYIHTEEYISSALKDAGFTNIKVFNKHLEKNSSKDERLFFAAVKENYVRHTT